MFELIDTQPDCNVQESEYKRLLGFPAGHVLEGRSRQLADEARQWYLRHGRPWIYAREIEGVSTADDTVRVNGTVFSSPQLRNNFSEARAHGAVLAMVSAGPECEEQARSLWLEGKPDEYFFFEMFGSAVVEHLVSVASGKICAWADGQGTAVLPHYSPGYSGWDVADQSKLFHLAGKDNGHFPGTLEVLETGMLRPKKSLLAFFGLTRYADKVRRRLVPCDDCSLQGCQYRRSPYQHAPAPMEDVRRLQPSNVAYGVRHDAKYSLNLKALRKWSQERLRLSVGPDGSIEARFVYEGTTCSNLGRPLEYAYEILLGPASSGYEIRELACRPAAGDTGHALQCEYLRDAPGFMLRFEAEKPLLGRPLDDVLSWQRAYSPSGCYCASECRMHKWGLVYEVIHFALAQREKEGAVAGQVGAVLEQ